MERKLLNEENTNLNFIQRIEEMKSIALSIKESLILEKNDILALLTKINEEERLAELKIEEDKDPIIEDDGEDNISTGGVDTEEEPDDPVEGPITGPGGYGADILIDTLPPADEIEDPPTIEPPPEKGKKPIEVSRPEPPIKVDEFRDKAPEPFKKGGKKTTGPKEKDGSYGAGRPRTKGIPKLVDMTEPEWEVVDGTTSSPDTGLSSIRRHSGGKSPKPVVVKAPTIKEAVIYKEEVTIKELSEIIGRPSADIISKLFAIGIMKNINEVITFEEAELVSLELGVILEQNIMKSAEDEVLEYYEKIVSDTSKMKIRPPIITIMGHVDHGKTSILDYIRKANVTQGEAGGITQHIGAYSIEFAKQMITFVDTPGHAAFTEMRLRGAQLTDIVVIVVAADDGIMPQTKEAINHCKAADVNIIVAINKIDKGIDNLDKILTELTKYDLLPEEWGGSIPCVRVSAKTGEGIEKLLQTILATAEVMEIKAHYDEQYATGIIIESKLDKGKGAIGTVIVKDGILKIGDHIVVGNTMGKIRAMYDDMNKRIQKAEPSKPVSIIGLQDAPLAGDTLFSVKDEKTAKQIWSKRLEKRELKLSEPVASKSLEDLFREAALGQLRNLNLIIKTDVQGSAEVLQRSLEELSNDEVQVKVIHSIPGAINESDIILAEMTESIVIGFNVRPDAKSKKLAETQKIEIKTYRVIYDIIDDITQIIKGLSAPKYREEYLGTAEVRQVYQISGVGVIAGCMVKEGKVIRNSKVRLIRENIVILETEIASLKRNKDDVREVSAGYECGIGLNNLDDLKEGDMIESFILKEEK